MKVAVLTLLLTNKCPLDCRYCLLHDDMLEESVEQTLDQLRETIAIFKAGLGADTAPRILFTGGEPFVRWNDIKILIEENPDCYFDFNTSGYLLTPERIKWLTQYSVTWNLSVDGGEELTNYLRPLRHGETGVRYYQRMSAWLPSLLFYYPNVSAKMIIGIEYVDRVFQEYLNFEKMGFKNMTMILDLSQRDSTRYKNVWTDEHLEILNRELTKIAIARAEGLANGIRRMEVRNMEDILKILLNGGIISPDRLECQVFAGRINDSLFGDQDHKKLSGCWGTLFKTQDEFRAQLDADLAETGNKCPNDVDCPFFVYCSARTCPKDNYEITGNSYKSEMSFCNLAKAAGNAALVFLDLSNKIPNNIGYQKYLLAKQKGVISRGC